MENRKKQSERREKLSENSHMHDSPKFAFGIPVLFQGITR